MRFDAPYFFPVIPLPFSPPYLLFNFFAKEPKFLLYKNSLNDISAETLEGEFTELFMTRMLCPPYENSYGKIGANKAGTLADISAFYKAFGLSILGGEEMLDHIAVEMEFMSLLMLKEAYGTEQGLNDMTDICDSAKKKFIGEHLGRWTGAFCKNLTDKTTKDFYKNLARFTEKFIDGETMHYGIEVEYVKGIVKDEIAEGPIICPVKEI